MNFAKNEMAVILAKLFATFDLELLTQSTRAPMSFSGTRPTPTFVRYCRRAAGADARAAGHDA